MSVLLRRAAGLLSTFCKGATRKVIYPNGPNTGSAASAALASCASPGYYFQVTSASDIATGFITLSDKFIYNTPYLTQ